MFSLVPRQFRDRMPTHEPTFVLKKEFVSKTDTLNIAPGALRMPYNRSSIKCSQNLLSLKDRGLRFHQWTEQNDNKKQ